MLRCIKRLQQSTSIYPLILFRVLFGTVMLFSIIRFMARGWVTELYIIPQFHFTYFDWLYPLPPPWLWFVFIMMACLTFCIIIGFYYRLAMATFFLLFTYVELLDKSYYLNHYYFVSLLSLLLIFLPLHKAYSVDSWCWPHLKTAVVPQWTILIIRLQLASVYFFAGIAKLNSDWLFNAMPLKIWLAGNTHVPLIGHLFDYEWMAYSMSWGGALFDLTIPFLLFWRKSRRFAYIGVILFHMMTGYMFPIGIFPWLMIACTLIFFDWGPSAKTDLSATKPIPKIAWALTTLFFLFQLAMPLRHHFYPHNVLWTEEGFRFSWRVMLVEKTGDVTFYVSTPDNQRQWVIYPQQYLTPQQAKQMAFQPDMILQFAHYLEEEFADYGNVSVTAEAYVSLNGRSSRLLIDPTIDLTTQQNSWHSKTWIIPLDS